LTDDHSKSHAEFNNPSNRRNHFNSNQSYQSDKSVGVKSNKDRNRSFSSFLNQQEAYGAFESIQVQNPKVKNNLSRHMSTHSLSSFASANQLELSMSYIEKTARKLFPILTELKKRMIPEKPRSKVRSDSIVAAIDDDSDDLVIDLAAE
jgi:hypothetical protein